MTPRRTLLLCGGALLAATAASPSRADDQSDALLKQVETATAATQTLTADLELTQKAKDEAGHDVNQKFQGAVKLKKPNLARIYVSMGPGNAQTTASNGKALYFTFGNQFMKNTPGAKGENIQAMWAFQVPIFFGAGVKSLGDATTKYLGKETVDGTEYEVISLVPKQMEGQQMKLYVSPDKLVTRLVMDVDASGQKMQVGAALKNVKRNVVLDDTAFAYTPPKTATLYKQPDYNAMLVPVGKPAPKFDLLRPEGGKISLENTLKAKKAVLVNFWFYG
jgi:outer membrane lipoprotein-sorting protein